MCRNIKQLFNFEPPATEDEIEAASLQFVRKVSGMVKPSQVNEVAFKQAVEQERFLFKLSNPFRDEGLQGTPAEIVLQLTKLEEYEVALQPYNDAVEVATMAFEAALALVRVGLPMNLDLNDGRWNFMRDGRVIAPENNLEIDVVEALIRALPFYRCRHLDVFVAVALPIGGYFYSYLSSENSMGVATFEAVPVKWQQLDGVRHVSQIMVILGENQYEFLLDVDLEMPLRTGGVEEAYHKRQRLVEEQVAAVPDSRRWWKLWK